MPMKIQINHAESVGLTVLAWFNLKSEYLFHRNNLYYADVGIIQMLSLVIVRLKTYITAYAGLMYEGISPMPCLRI